MARLLLWPWACCGLPLFLACFLPAHGADCGRGQVRVASVAGGPLGKAKDKEACLGLFIDSKSNADCGKGLTKTDPAEGEDPGEVPDKGNLKLLEVRAVYYVPRPVGANLHVDVYTKEYRGLHERDLPLIKNVLKANTIRLAPWDPKKDHKPFMDLCKEVGLWVIPTFDLKSYLDLKWKVGAQRVAIENQITPGVESFLKNSSSDQVLAWSVNYALPLWRSAPSDTPKVVPQEVKDYFVLMCIMRHQHYKQEYRSKDRAYARPLALPVDINTWQQAESVGFYMGLAETQWGLYPDCPEKSLSGMVSKEDLNNLSPLGAFDMWIVQGLAVADSSGGYERMQESLQQATTQMKQSRKSDAQWTDVFTMKRDEKGDLKSSLQKCGSSAKGGCTYRTRKAVLAQLGFTPLEADKKDPALKALDPGAQTASFQKAWVDLVIDDNAPLRRVTCSSGVVVDEWMDDWDRTATYGDCKSNPYLRLTTQVDTCTGLEETVSRDLYPEWMGINSQMSLFHFQCIFPHLKDGKLFTFDGMTDVSFGFAGCATLRVSVGPINWGVLTSIAICVAMLAAGTILRCCHLLRRGASSSLPRDASTTDVESSTDGSRPSMPSGALEAVCEEGAADIETATRSERPAMKESTKVVVPDIIREAQPPGPDSFSVTLQWTAQGKGAKQPDRPRLTNGRARLLLQRHTTAQSRRLTQQVDAEISELACIRGGPYEERTPSDAAMAMVNIHARVLEGYLVFLQRIARRQSPEESRLNLLLGAPGAPPRSPAMLYIEALVLRVIESLGEHMVHAPEFLARFYHNVVSKSDTGVDFVIDYEELHKALESIMKNSDIFHGGLNFDDINDCGLAGTELRKTFRESPSWLVLIDVLSNFQPVFTIKLWVFLLAGVIHSAVSSMTREVPPEITVLLDTLLLLGTEVPAFCLGIYQRRCSWRTHRARWLLRRFLYPLVGLLGCWVYWSVTLQPIQGDKFLKYTFIIGFWVIRGFIFLLLNWSWDSSTPYMPGRPKAAKVPEKDPITSWRRTIWVFMLACCVGLEATLLIPYARRLVWNEMCRLPCELDSPMDFRVYSTTCIGCSVSFSLLWALVGGTAFFITYYMFYFGSAIVGYVMGHTRMLGGILYTAQRNIKLNSGVSRRLADINVGGVGEVSDAMLMRKVFGPSWRMVWSRMVEALREDCLIISKDASKLVEAANTIRWKERFSDQKSLLVLPCDRFRKLRFVPWAHRSPNPAQQEGTFASSGSMMSGGSWQPRQVGPCISAIKLQVSADRTQDIIINEARFQADNPYQEVIIDLPKACPIFAFWYQTSRDGNNGGDPTKWALYGLVEGSDNTWKQLFAQADPFVPTSDRGVFEGPFVVEFFQKKVLQHGGDRHSSTMALKSLPDEAGERLCFFLASLRHLASRTGDATNPIESKLRDYRDGNVPSLTQIIPCYDETVILSESYLIESDGVNTNLSFIISQYPEEWEFFAQHHNLSPRELYWDFIEDIGSLDDRLCMEVRMWASMRSQSVARTVVGAMQYHEALNILPDVQGCPEADLSGRVDLILAHQTFGTKVASRGEDASRMANDAAVLYLMWKYHKHPFHVVFDFTSDSARMEVKDLVRSFLRELGFSGSDAPKYASILACFQPSSASKLTHGSFRPDQPPYKEALKIVEVLPRSFPLLLGSGKFRTQGKAGNQLGALRFAPGHYVQMMDANMGAFFGEACKVPFLLREFQPSIPGEQSRKSVACRILGFREVIFTEKHGATGSIMAAGEWSFGTICQRFLDGLDVRMHYGHPDFIDGFWASNRGSLSKASPAINLSEDIFAGFNVRMRGERSVHRDLLAWDKGREASFNAASQFFTKVSSGSVGVMRSRDLKIITERLGIFDNLSFYFASVAFYFNTWLIDMSLQAYVLVFTFLTLSSINEDSIGELGGMLASEWVLTIGIIAMIPRLMELMLEYGNIEGLGKFIRNLPGIIVGFTFFNKSAASAVLEALLTGEASYIKTGRPNANKHYTWRECYFVHCQSHYYPAFRIFFLYMFNRTLATQSFAQALPMVMVLFCTVIWLVGPILFCPQPRYESIKTNARELFHFCIDKPPLTVRKMTMSSPVAESLHAKFEDPQATLYEFWLLQNLRHKSRSKTLQAAIVLWNLAIFLLEIALSPSMVFGVFWRIFVIFIVHTCLIGVWRCCNRPEALWAVAMLLMFGAPTIVFPLVFEGVTVGSCLFSYVLLSQGLEVLRSSVLLLARLLFGAGFNWSTMPSKTPQDRLKRRAAAIKDQRYDILVEYFYVNFLAYEMHLARAACILLLNLVTQAILLLLDALCGLHSCWLLNWNLGCALGVINRVPYEPGQQTAGHREHQRSAARRATEVSPAAVLTEMQTVPLAARRDR